MVQLQVPYMLYIIAITEVLSSSIFGDFLIFVVSGQGMRAALIGTIHFFIGYPENVKYPPNKNCLSCSSHKIIRKRVYLSVKMTSLDQKHKTVMKVACLGVSQLCISFKYIKIIRKVAYLIVRKYRKS